MTKTDHTTDAKRSVGDFILRAGKSFLVLRCGDVFDDELTIRVTPNDVAEFFATQARNLSSGFTIGVPVPADVTTPEAVIAFAQAHASRTRCKVFVALRRRESVGFSGAGGINGRFFATPDSAPNPCTQFELALKCPKFAGWTPPVMLEAYFDSPREASLS